MKLRLTNKLGLPQPIVEAMLNDPYNSGNSDYTATSLLQPPRALHLSRTTEVVEDAADRLYALQGQLMHLILERAGRALSEQGFVVEKRFKTTYSIGTRIFKVSAQVDLFDPVSGTLSDYKYTSVGSLKHGLKEDHRLQLNVQAELIRRAGFKVEKAEVILLLRDWSAERDYEGYPLVPYAKMDIPLLSSEEINKWIVDRIVQHESAKVSLPICTEEERWSRPTFSITKADTNKRAIRVFDNEEEAKEYQSTKRTDAIVSKREGKSIRCLRYCPVRLVCEQAKEYRPSLEIDKDGFVKVTN